MVGMVRFEKEYRERASPAIWGSCPGLQFCSALCAEGGAEMSNLEHLLKDMVLVFLSSQFPV
eukprot:1160927-Pelagomonas_calceolata.AAC.4